MSNLKSALEENEDHLTKRAKVERTGENFQSPPKCEVPVLNELGPSLCSDATPFDKPFSASCSDRHDVKDLLLKEANYDIDSPTNVKRREDYLSWESYFMAIAYLSAQRSKHPLTQSGACIVDEDKRIIGIGYNGFPRSCSDDCLPWASSTDTNNILHTHHPYTCHAEVNAILNKSSTDVKGSTMYVPELPCNECAKLIIQSGISEIVYFRNQRDDDSSRASRIMFGMAGVKLRQYNDNTKVDPLDFSIYGSNRTEVDDSEKIQKEREKYRDLLQTEASYDVNNPIISKRSDYLSWDDYFTCVAYLSARRSKDPNTQVGAVIVDENKCIIAIGYNGFPRGCSDEHLPWARSGASELHKKYAFVTHAEVNAVLNKGSKDVKGATIYVALFPCNECAKIIVQSGIKEVVYLSDVYHDTDSCRASRIMFSMAGVKTRMYIPSKEVSSFPMDIDASYAQSRQRVQKVIIDTPSNKPTQSEEPRQKEATTNKANEKRHAFDIEIDKLRAEFRNNPDDIFSAIKLAQALGMRTFTIHDGGSVIKETIDMHLKAIALVEDARSEMIKNGQDIYTTSSGTKPESLNEEMFLPHAKKSNQGLLLSLYCDLSKQYYMAEMFEDSFRAANHVVALEPTYIDALAQRGMAAFVLGKFDQSRDDYQKVLDVDTYGAFPDAFTGTAKALKALEASKDEWLNFTGRVNELIPKYEYMSNKSGLSKPLAEALKKMHQSLFLFHDGVTKDAEQAFFHIDEAYKLKMKFVEPYNAAVAQQQLHLTQQIFSKTFFPENMGSDSSSLIFIIGFPRSGSTLLERILDAHSAVAGTGEDSIFNGRLDRIRHSIVQASMTESPDILKQVIQQNADEVESLTRSRWESRLHGSSETTPKKFVDKMLMNYVNVGFIHMLFPNALILHISRDPMATLWSAFHHEFPPGSLDHTCNLESIVHIYNKYISLIDHWDTVLPGRITHIRYEDIVNDPETLSKSIIAATGLEWEDRVLQFHSIEHAVGTFSSHQVRKKIYKNSNESWKRYEPFLNVDGVSVRDMLGQNVIQKYSTTLKLVA